MDEGYFGLSEDDFAFVTAEAVALVPSGRVVSVLEGGYQVHPNHPGNPNVKNSNFELAAEINDRPIRVDERFFGALARSCAAHVTSLMEAPLDTN